MSVTPKRRPKLLAVKPESVAPRKPKILLFGAAGIGKTWLSLDFNAVYFIDSEGGATQPHYMEKLKSSGGLYLGPDDGASSFDVVMDQIKALTTENHDRKTLVIDSITKLFANAIAREAESLADAGKKNEFGADRKPAVNHMRQLVSWITRLDMTVILIAGEIAEWGRDERGERAQVGETFDCWPRLEYELDLAIRIVKSGNNRYGKIRKTRIDAFPEAGTFPLSYDEFANRYGRAALEAKAVPVDLATPEQLAELTRLLAIVVLPPGTEAKWLAAANVSSWDEMPKARAAKAIVYINGLLAGNGEKS